MGSTLHSKTYRPGRDSWSDAWSLLVFIIVGPLVVTWFANDQDSRQGRKFLWFAGAVMILPMVGFQVVRRLCYRVEIDFFDNEALLKEGVWTRKPRPIPRMGTTAERIAFSDGPNFARITFGPEKMEFGGLLGYRRLQELCDDVNEWVAAPAPE